MLQPKFCHVSKLRRGPGLWELSEELAVRREKPADRLPALWSSGTPFGRGWRLKNRGGFVLWRRTIEIDKNRVPNWLIGK